MIGWFCWFELRIEDKFIAFLSSIFAEQNNVNIVRYRWQWDKVQVTDTVINIFELRKIHYNREINRAEENTERKGREEVSAAEKMKGRQDLIDYEWSQLLDKETRRRLCVNRNDLKFKIEINDKKLGEE